MVKSREAHVPREWAFRMSFRETEVSILLTVQHPSHLSQTCAWFGRFLKSPAPSALLLCSPSRFPSASSLSYSSSFQPRDRTPVFYTAARMDASPHGCLFCTTPSCMVESWPQSAEVFPVFSLRLHDRTPSLHDSSLMAACSEEQTQLLPPCRQHGWISLTCCPLHRTLAQLLVASFLPHGRPAFLSLCLP